MHDNVEPLFKEETLADLEAKIDRELAIEGTNALESAIRIGEWLTRIKNDHLKHGQFGPWLKEHFKRKKVQASRYMMAAEHKDELRAKVSSEETFRLNSFYKLLPPKPRPKGKPRGRPRGSPGKKREWKPDAKIRKALDALIEVGPAGMTQLELTRAGDLASPAGLARTVVDGLMVIVEGRYYATGFSPIPLPELPPSGQKLIDAYKNRIEKEFTWRVDQAARAHTQKWLEEYRIPEYEKKFEQVVKLLSRARSLLTREELAVWRKCLHPNAVDLNGVHRYPDLLNSAFAVLKRVQDALVIPEDMKAKTMEDVRSPQEIMDELLARRAQKS